MVGSIDDLICIYGELLVRVRVYSYVRKRYSVGVIHHLIKHGRDWVPPVYILPRVNALVERDLESDGDNDVLECGWEGFDLIWATIVDYYRDWLGGMNN